MGKIMQGEQVCQTFAPKIQIINNPVRMDQDLNELLEKASKALGKKNTADLLRLYIELLSVQAMRELSKAPALAPVYDQDLELDPSVIDQDLKEILDNQFTVNKGKITPEFLLLMMRAKQVQSFRDLGYIMTVKPKPAAPAPKAKKPRKAKAPEQQLPCDNKAEAPQQEEFSV